MYSYFRLLFIFEMRTDGISLERFTERKKNIVIILAQDYKSIYAQREKTEQINRIYDTNNNQWSSLSPHLTITHNQYTYPFASPVVPFTIQRNFYMSIYMNAFFLCCGWLDWKRWTTTKASVDDDVNDEEEDDK